ncbi:2Fe-2S iron-sulfur cluster binding domain-containing protein [Purpureocillium lilacinum]|uniref:2Fe-2S iron-sulfur cluster binding domain-containing protein n=1 Tax=Purpureocillium lilacinum TaxID=33203 RepID=A0A179GJI1_PURLI|nr:2Fe-2S iron-sulfur cluster binding domain-containing protein [Purpureocillium lilacinum]
MSASRSVAAGLAGLPTVACRSLQPGRLQMKTALFAPSFAVQVKPTSAPRWTLALSPARRTFTTTTPRRHGHIEPPKPGEELYVTFIEKDGEEHKFAVSEGDNLLDIAQANDLEMEGACGGSCACSTCHVIVVDEDKYDKMPEPEDDENDMLDLAFGLTETSRLGCQVKMTKELDGLVVKLPSMTRNLQASDFQ